ncbi:MAG: hypothetical protein CME62_07375 [Halobacteriovoraceae bacterium]|nr:hypothetical protein [Halobacteriovoraceae bacterium]|tara:strand:+ start:37965 stop:38198 length:234 start_codon:yes stop_codon:yes gene_type:complete
MDQNQKTAVLNFLDRLSSLDEKQVEELVNKYLDDEIIEEFVDHIEDFYGIEDDEQLGVLAQIMVTGFIAAKETSSQS